MNTTWLIRHGESSSNAGQPTDHPSTIPLTDRGRAQAERVVRAFDRAPDLFVVSPYHRTRETAAPTLRAFPGVEVVEWPLQEFTYVAPPRYKGTTVEERRVFVREYWRRGDPDFRDEGGGESFRDLVGRVEQARDLITGWHRENPGRFLAVFSHGQFIRAFTWWHLRGSREIDSRAMTEFLGFLRGVVVPNCGIVQVESVGEGLLLGGIRVDHLGTISWPDEAAHDAIWTREE
jgi:broad specificity phosphatase PhoE